MPRSIVRRGCLTSLTLPHLRITSQSSRPDFRETSSGLLAMSFSTTPI
jgi:hypothetical protein